MELQIDEERNTAHIKLSGILTEKDLLRAFDVVVSSKGYKKRMGRLWNFRDANLSSLSPAAVDRLAHHRVSDPAGISDVKVALVPARPVEYGLARMFEAFASDSRKNVRIFRDIQKAEAWMAE